MQSPQKIETKEDVLKEIEGLVHGPGFIYAISTMIVSDTFISVEDIVEVDWKKRLGFQEISIFIGFMIREEVDMKRVGPEKIQELSERIKDLTTRFHEAHLKPFRDIVADKVSGTNSDGDTSSRSSSSVEISGELMTEPMFYGDSGAYDFQYAELATKRYKEDAIWLMKKKSLDMDRVKLAVEKIKNLQEKKRVDLFSKPDVFNLDDLCLEALCFKREDLAFLSDEEFESFIASFGTELDSNSQFRGYGDYNVIDSHPIIILGDGRYYLPVAFNLFQSIYESPFYWMNEDEQYIDQASENRGSATENIVLEMLENTFGSEKVYRSVNIKKGRNVYTEIDVLVLLGDKAVIFQIKSKKLTELSKKGDNDALVNDFNAAIQQAYNQGLKSREGILNQDKFTLEGADGSTIEVEDTITDTHIICVTLDNYPATLQQVHSYLRIEDGDPHPLVINVFDLDLILFYLDDLYTFLYYLRLREMHHKYFRAESEISLLAYHLRHKLWPLEGTDVAFIDNKFAQMIDAHFLWRRGGAPRPEGVETLFNTWENNDFRSLILQIKEIGPENGCKIIFTLLDLEGKGADDLMEGIRKTKLKIKADKKVHDFSVSIGTGEIGLTFMSLPDKSKESIDTFNAICLSRMHKERADEWIGLASFYESKNVIDILFFSDAPLIEDLK